MTPAEYDAWYDTPRGRWVGETEYRLVRDRLGMAPGETLLDVGCGSGWFTRRFGREPGWRVTGLDRDAAMLAFALAHGHGEGYVRGDALALPFADASFDRVVSVAALCFVADARQAVAEIARVARRRFVIGWLNRASLWHRRHAGRPAYRGAAWRTAAELRALFADLPVRCLTLNSAVFLPDGGRAARAVEALLPARLPYGALLVVAGEVSRHGTAKHPYLGA